MILKSAKPFPPVYHFAGIIIDILLGFNFFDTSASFLDIKNMTLTKGQGKLLFDDQKTFFKTQKAFLNNKPIDVEGTCTLKGLLDFKISAKIA